MAYDEGLAQRLRELFCEDGEVTEKHMFGGLAFMLHGHMCCGVVNDTLMARVGPEKYADALGKSHVREMDFTGKPLTGFVYVDPDGIESDDDLKAWIAMCRSFVTRLPPK